MICNHCKEKTASCHIKENINGVKRDLYLCSDCYRELYASETLMNTADVFSAFFGGGVALKPDTSPVCPSCGTTLSEVERTGLVGCADCYTVFREELLPSIKQMHGKAFHEGKTPLVGADIFRLETELKRLMEEFDKARNENRMDDALKFNKQIIQINRLIKDVKSKSEENK